MKIELNDETLTAYALGELSDAEVDAVDRALAEAAQYENNGPQKTLDEIRTTIALSQAVFAAGTEDYGLRKEQRDNLDLLLKVRGEKVRFPWRAAGLAAAVLAVIAVYGAVSMIETVRPADGLQEARAETPAGKAEREFDELQALNVGIERFLITDINNPGSSRPNFSNPEVQRIVSEVHENTTGQRQRQTDSSLGFPLLGAPAPAMPEQAADRDVLAAAPSAGASGNLQNVQVGGTINVRGDWYSSDGAVAAVPPPAVPMVLRADSLSIVARNAETSQNLGVEEMERLKSLGYSSDDASASQSRRIDFSWNAAPGFSTSAVFDDRLQRYVRAPQASPGVEAYKPIIERGFTRVMDEPLSTFSIDVDTASYANVRRFLQQGQLPPPDAVRVEEMINYFDYAYGQPEGNTPFAAHFEMAICPWEPQHTLVRIGLKGREIPRAERPATNLVFLIDVSGSMQPANKLPLVKWAMSQLASQLDERDRVAIVTYASGVNLALPSTNASNQPIIQNTIASLGAGGSTNGAGGIQMAYQVARQNYLPGGVNRVILATDGDFNVGLTDNGALEQMIQAEARTGVFLSVYGYGMGNLKDDRLEMLADKGNGTYGYIDSEAEARREFIEKLSGTLVTIAKDVKVQVEFNPARVGAYRLIGYENRALAAQDFNDDRKDAGEIGAGHTVTALYEVVPSGLPVPAAGDGVDPLRYQQTAQPSVQVEAARIAPESHPARAAELLTVKLRYKEPEGHESKLLEFPLTDAPFSPEQTSGDFKFASAVAAFGKLLRGNPLGANLTYDGMMQLAQDGLQGSADPHRAEMISLMLQARPLLEGRETMTRGPENFIGGEIQLLRIREMAQGRYRAQIRTPSRTGWYEAGQAFESYELVNVDPIAGCVDIYMESLQRTVRLCMQSSN